MRFVIVGALVLAVAAAPASLKVWSVVVLVVVGWVVLSLLYPQRDCPSCDGSNKHRDPVTGRNYHPCGHCNGTGRVLRLVPRLIGRR